ncbi:MAG: hypothetical protein GF381_02785 [Candidatus Pacebacteria bacterium]|nr:hypothetical protein [Candidatus Paceibacterota bacterium]
MQPFKTYNWYQFLTPWQRQLAQVTQRLLEEHKNTDLPDYSFIVFSISKMYEGFLKKLFYDLGLITVETYEGRRFRIGRALNPDVAQHQRDQYWLYDDVARLCNPKIARQLWQAWLKCRNRVFHFFPKDKGLLTYQEAVEKVRQVVEAMGAAVACYNQHYQK